MNSKSILNHPYFLFISWILLMSIGRFFLLWDPIQILFFFYLEYLIQFCVILVTTLSKSKDKTDDVANLFILGVFFLLFTLFALFGIYWANPFAGKFFDYIGELFSISFGENLWVIFLMIGLSIFEAFKFSKKSEDQQKNNGPFGARWFLKILAALPFIGLIALVFNGAGFMSPSAAFFLIVLVLGGFEVFWINYQKKYLAKNQS